MRLLLVRNAFLAFAIAAVLLIATLGAVTWNHSIAIQRAREATILATDESRLLEALRQVLAASDRARLDYDTHGQPADLATLSDQTTATHALARQIEQTAAHDPNNGAGLIALAEAVDARAAAAERAEALHEDRPQHDAPAILPEVTDAARTAAQRRVMNLELTTERLRTARLLAASVALLGIVCVLGMVFQLVRAWRQLRLAELESRSIASQLHASLDSLSQGVAVFSASGLLVNWNLRLGQLLNLQSDVLQQGLAYDTLAARLAVENTAILEPIAEILADVPNGPDPRPVVYERTLHRTGLHADAQPEAAAQIEFHRTLMPQGGFVLTVTDITERMQSERLLSESQKMQALGQLTGGIAHDFNNMLTVILGNLEVSSDDLTLPEGEPVRLLLGRMRRAAQAAGSGAALTRQLLAFARKQPLTPVAADLAAILPDLMPLVRHMIGEGIGVAFEIEPGLWPAMIDVGQLQSAVLNLALNARDAMPDGGKLVIGAANITIDAALAPPSELPPELPRGEYVRISVGDTGHGMSPEVIARAFEPFFTTKSEGHGTGLGLAMVFSFADKSGGRATIQSAPGLGTTIAIFLPRSLVAPEASPDAEFSQHDGSIAHAQAAQLHILLVDDDDQVREVTADNLRGLGYLVSLAASASEALDQVRRLATGAFDLLLTDITLHGGMDGTVLADHVVAHSPQTRVLFMSGTLEGLAPAALDGADPHWLSKPFRRRQLAEAVDLVLADPVPSRMVSPAAGGPAAGHDRTAGSNAMLAASPPSL